MNRRTVLGHMAGLLMLSPVETAMSAGGERADGMPVFRRGIGVAHWMGWADVEPDGSYGAPPFSARRFDAAVEERRALRWAGFDFVRLVVDVGPFLAFEGSRREQLDDLLLGTVTALLDDDLGVIVDLHPSAMTPAYRPAMLTGGAETPMFRAVSAFLSRLSGRLATLASRRPQGRPVRLALELMNEPEIAPRIWQPMLEAAYSAARHDAPRLPLVIGGGDMNSAAALEAIDMRPFRGDDRIIYTFHDYAPWQFTHQGLRGNPAYVFDEVPYPAPATPDAMLRATEARIAGLPLGGAERAQARTARQALESYVRSGFDWTAMEALFTRVSAWRTAQGLPAQAILLGEFGVHLTSYGRTAEGVAARGRWLRDMRELAEAHGFAWACWTYAGAGGFVLAEDGTGPGFSPSTSDALGLELTHFDGSSSLSVDHAARTMRRRSRSSPARP